MITLANPRPQKRLDLLPAILAAARREFRRRGIDRHVELVIVGEVSRGSQASESIVDDVHVRARQLGVADGVHWVSGETDARDLLAAADVLVSTSAYEGLSLAHLEALAMELPVVATSAGGTAEIAVGNPALLILPLDAPPQQFAEALAELAKTRVSGRAQAARWFSQESMTTRYRWLYRRAIARASHQRPHGLLLVTNNFSIGGAQASARRLLLGLAAQGVAVRAAVLQEDPDLPTPGREALLRAGIEVIATLSIEKTHPAEVVTELLAAIDSKPPEAVLLWNVVPVCKVLLADALLDARIFDVSPGEMFFSSLAQYFNRPLLWLPYRTPKDYGARLSGAVVKFSGEAKRAAEILGVSVEVIPNGVNVPAALGASAQPLNLEERSAALILQNLPCAESSSAKAKFQRALRNGKPDVLVVGTSARLNPQKRLEDLLDALRLAHPRLPTYVLRVAGEKERGCDEYAAMLCDRAKGLPVEWLGSVGDIATFLSALDLFVMISEPAGCPNASLEAMAAGLPVIATDVGGASEQVLDQITGRLVPPRHPAALAEALVELAWDRKGRADFGQAGCRHVSAHFSVERMVSDYRRLCGL